MKKLANTLLALWMLTGATAAFASTSQPAAVSAPTPNFVLSYEDTESAVSSALSERGVGSKVAATIMGTRKDYLYASDKPLSVEIRGLNFDKKTQRWTANLLCISGEEVLSALPIGGRYEQVVELPVLKRTVRADGVITPEDIELKNYPVSRLQGDVVQDMNTLVGKSPLRVISANRPIRKLEVAEPNVVKKNSIVQMRYTTTGMQISTNGQVQNDAGVGQVVAVRNVASNKLVYAVVSDANTVTVLPAGTQQISQQVGANAYETN